MILMTFLCAKCLLNSFSRFIRLHLNWIPEFNAYTVISKVLVFLFWFCRSNNLPKHENRPSVAKNVDLLLFIYTLLSPIQTCFEPRKFAFWLRKTIENNLSQYHYYPYFRLSFVFTQNRKI